MIYCPACGVPNSESLSICGRCGSALVYDGSVEPIPPLRKLSRNIRSLDSYISLREERINKRLIAKEQGHLNFLKTEKDRSTENAVKAILKGLLEVFFGMSMMIGFVYLIGLI